MHSLSEQQAADTGPPERVAQNVATHSLGFRRPMALPRPPIRPCWSLLANAKRARLTAVWAAEAMPPLQGFTLSIDAGAMISGQAASA